MLYSPDDWAVRLLIRYIPEPNAANVAVLSGYRYENRT
jgi:hypothetical protein